LEFQAEIIRTAQRKLSSGDNQYEVVFRTENPMCLDLGKLPSDSLFRVSVELVAKDNKQHNMSKENARSNRYAV
jgi:hypothetical protein